MTDKITESLYTRTKHLRGMSEEDRRRLAIEKAKSSTEAVISAYVRLEHKATREFKTLSTGSVYCTEDYIDYNAFLKVLVSLINKFGNENTWKPEGDLIFKTDEGINQASIRDSATRGSLVNMSDLAPHVFNLMKEQRLDSSRFFGRMCEAFLKRRLPEDIVTQIRETLWKVVEADKLFESDLGLNKRVQKKFEDTDIDKAVEDLGSLPLEEFIDAALREFSEIPQLNPGYGGEDPITIKTTRLWFLYFEPKDSISYNFNTNTASYDSEGINTVRIRINENKQKFQVYFSYYKKEKVNGYHIKIKPIEVMFGSKRGWNIGDIENDPDTLFDLSWKNLLAAKKWLIEFINKTFVPNQLTESSLGLNKHIQKKFSEKSVEDTTEELSYIVFEDKKVEEICHRLGIYTKEDAASVEHLWTIENGKITNTWFSGDQKIKKFNELQYFTSLKQLDTGVFSYCRNLEEITLPKGLVAIKNYVFSGCEKLKEIRIPEGVMSIGDQAFEGCHSLVDVYLPNSLVSIGLNPFIYCYNLEHFYILRGNQYLQKRLDSFRKGKTVEIDINESNLGLNKHVQKKFNDVDAIDNVSQIPFKDKEVERICHEHGVYTIGDAIKVTSIKEWFVGNDNIKTFNEFKYFTGLKEIEEIAFYECKSLESINIPNSVTSIGSRAFADCKSLRSINIPNSVTGIEEGVFQECHNLRSINIPDSVTSIGESAFWYSAVQSINIPDSVTSIGDNTFAWCDNLQSIDIPDSVTSIGDRAFEYCENLKSINIPDSVTSIGIDIFLRCWSLEKIYISMFHPLRQQLHEQNHSIELVDPNKVNESTSLGLNKHVQKKFDNVDAVDNISDYVDLGLPSGTLWCKHNYGAKSEEEYGKYFIFRDVQKLDNVQIPSITDFIELNDYCHHKWTEINGINGMTFISMKNGNSVFFPAAGYCKESVEYNVKFSGCYWSSDEDSDNNNMDGLRMHFINSAVFPNVPSRHKFFEFSVRTVRKP